MSRSKVVNSQSFHDGKVVLYQLDNRPRKRWLCRIKVPNGRGYIYRGTGTPDLYEARKFADSLHDELRIKVKLGQAVTGKSFKQIWNEFQQRYPSEARSANSARDVCEFIARYALPYFSSIKIMDVTEASISEFFDWRRQNGRAKRPSSSTIIIETSHLKVFFDWCFQRGHINRQLKFTRPSKLHSPRSHFTTSEWSRLTRFLREWVKRGHEKNGGTRRDRIMLASYVLVLANTGIRIGEARKLKWSDLETFPGDHEQENIALAVKGKTGPREVVARTPAVKEYLERIWKLRCEELKRKPSRDEHIFCHRDGKPIHSFKKGFAALIKEAGVEFDSKGERRVIYSLRHTYATFRLHEGVNPYTLAKNMGTSVKMLESFYGHTSNRAMATELTKTRSRGRKQLLWE
jgi:integrase